MKKNNIIRFGKFLIIISLFLIGTGLFIYYKDVSNFYDPVNDVKEIIKEHDDPIKIETNDKLVVPNKDNSEIDTDAKTNDLYRKKIENKYDINVFYGYELAKYRVDNMGVEIINNDSIVMESLKKLDNVLKTYPKDFFKEFIKEDMKLNVFLVKKYSVPYVTGITDFSSKYAIVSIAVDFPFEESFHHEIFHYMEHFIEKKGGRFVSWNDLNPVDFKYGNVQAKYSYDRTYKPDSFFVNNYAQVDSMEDRASTFEFMTAPVEYDCYISSKYPIWKKSKYMAKMIETYFVTVNSTNIEYWERYVN